MFFKDQLQFLEEKTVERLVALQDKKIVRIVRKTIYSLYPFILLGSFVQFIAVSVFMDFGFVGQVFSASSWIPHYSSVGVFFSNATVFTLGLIGFLATYYCAYYKAEAEGKNKSLAGITAVIVYLIVSSRTLLNNRASTGFSVNLSSLGSANLLWGLLIGYMIGCIFSLLHTKTDNLEEEHLINAPSLMAILSSLGLGLTISGVLAFATKAGIFTYFSTLSANIEVESSTVLTTLWNTFRVTLAAFVGMTEPFRQKDFTDDLFSTENLNYVITNHSTNGLPYPFTDTTLYHSFATFGGVGALLALVIALFMFSNNKRHRKIGLLGFLPTFFNNGTSIMIGLPVLFNPLYAIPFLLAPLLNVVLASIALATHLISPAVYPVPPGTPGSLFAFIGSGGDVRVLLLGMTCLVLDLFLYLPFIHFDEKVQEKIASQKEEER